MPSIAGARRGRHVRASAASRRQQTCSDEEGTVRGFLSFSSRTVLAMAACGLLLFLTVLVQLFRATRMVDSQQVASIQLRGFPAGASLSAALGATDGQAEVSVAHRASAGDRFNDLYSASTVVSRMDADVSSEKARLEQVPGDVSRFPAMRPSNFPAGLGAQLSGRHEASLPAAQPEVNLDEPIPGSAAIVRPGLPDGCVWESHDSKFLGGFVSEGDAVEVPLDEAKRRCRRAQDGCRGVTCSIPQQGEQPAAQCTPRKGMPYLQAGPSNEVSFTVRCTSLQMNEGLSTIPEVSTTSLIKALSLQSDGISPGAAGSWEAQLPPRAPVSSLVTTPPLLDKGRAVVVVIAHDRSECLERCLRSLLTSSKEDAAELNFAVSLDHGPSFGKMEAIIGNFASSTVLIDVWRKPEEQAKAGRARDAVAKIAAHFRFALSEAFDRVGFEYGVFIENDLTIAPDGLHYFRATGWLLEQDPSLFCVSAWNDNGFRGAVSDETRLFRTDYFPGLGWMIRKDTWGQLRGIWPRFPSTGWDHWMRHGSGLRDAPIRRECIVPEMSRTHHYSEHGTNVNAGSGIAQMLESMPLASVAPGQLGDLSYLLKSKYEDRLRGGLRKAKLIMGQELDRAHPGQIYLVPYLREEFPAIARSLKLLHGNPRTAHRGLILVKDPVTRALVALADRRQEPLEEGDTPYLPATERLLRHPSLEVMKAKPGESCDLCCTLRNLACEQRQLEFVNVCAELKKVFPCESGCGHQVGAEIPAYVHDRSKDTSLQCLVSDDAVPTCQASHPSTTRLCACVSRP